MYWESIFGEHHGTIDGVPKFTSIGMRVVKAHSLLGERFMRERKDQHPFKLTGAASAAPGFPVFFPHFS